MMIELLSGLHVAFEGPDGCGKTTLTSRIYEHFIDKYNTILTRHPGTTPLGKHLRKLLKSPESIDQEISYNNIIRQLIYLLDAMSFTNDILVPALRDRKLILADRCTAISAMIYGILDGVSFETIDKLYSAFNPPRLDRLYILDCPWEIRSMRLNARGEKLPNGCKQEISPNDYFDKQPTDFMKRLDEKYQNLLTDTNLALLLNRFVNFENVIYIDATRSEQAVFDAIIRDLESLITDKYVK